MYEHAFFAQAHKLIRLTVIRRTLVGSSLLILFFLSLVAETTDCQQDHNHRHHHSNNNNNNNNYNYNYNNHAHHHNHHRHHEPNDRHDNHRNLISRTRPAHEHDHLHQHGRHEHHFLLACNGGNHSNRHQFDATGDHVQCLHQHQHKHKPSSRSSRLAKRQARLDETMARLHILESLDEQLRAFAEAAEQAQRHTQPTTAASHTPQHDETTPTTTTTTTTTVRPDWPHAARGQNQSGVRWQAQQRRDFHCHLRVEARTTTTTTTASKRREANNYATMAAGNRNQGREQSSSSNELLVGRSENRPHELATEGLCLRNKKLLGQIPPFMLNLYRQLLFELQQAQAQTNYNFSQTVQSQMPYKAQIMRSFRQPKLYGPKDLGRSDLAAGGGVDGRGEWLGGARRAHEKDQTNDKSGRQIISAGDGEEAQTRQGGNQEEDESKGIGNVVVELSVAGEDDDEPSLDYASSPPSEPASVDSQHQSACNSKQRLLPVYERDEICFWFKLDDQLASLIGDRFEGRAMGAGGQLEETGSGRLPPSSPSQAERLIEAELHVFKLFPQLPPIAGQQTHSHPHQARDSSPKVVGTTNHIKTSAEFAQQETRQGSQKRVVHSQEAYAQPVANRTTGGGNIYHLKTNLLEVSLYQILPRKPITSTGTSKGGTNARARPQARTTARPQLDDEHPLRLLDIRRIDLNSNGWETFYVKRAVEDWLRDARLNLGLVIKAKSMFDEPVRVGLIRFADAYDHQEAATTTRAGEQSPSVEFARQRRHLRDFSLSHQPLLVIYTTKSGAIATSEQASK